MSPSQGGLRALGTAPPDCCRQRRRLAQASVPGALRPGRGWAGRALGAALSEMGRSLVVSPQAAQGRFCPAAIPAANSQAGGQALPCAPGRPLRAQFSRSRPGHLPPFILPGSPWETPSRPRLLPEGIQVPSPCSLDTLSCSGLAGRLHTRGMLVGRGRARPPLLEACTRLGGRRCQTDVTSSLSPWSRPAWAPAGVELTEAWRCCLSKTTKEGLGALQPLVSPCLRLLRPALEAPDSVQKDRPCPQASRAVRLSLDLPGAWGP